MSLVIDESLTRIELASGLSINQELKLVSLCEAFQTAQYSLTTSDPSIAVPPAIFETSPNGSSLGRRSAFSRAIYRSSPIEGSCDRQPEPLTRTEILTGSRIGRHINDRISAMGDIVMDQRVRLTSDLDIIAYRSQLRGLSRHFHLILTTLSRRDGGTAQPRPDVRSGRLILQLRSVIVDGGDVAVLPINRKLQWVGRSGVKHIGIGVGGKSKGSISCFAAECQ